MADVVQRDSNAFADTTAGACDESYWHEEMSVVSGPPYPSGVKPDTRYNLADSDFRVANQAKLAAHAILDRPRDVRIVAQELLGVLASLAESLAAVRKPGTAFLDDSLVDADVDEIAVARDAFAVHHVELRLAERRSHLVLHNFDACAAADDDVAVLDARNPADVQPNGGVELERPTASGGFGVAEHDADLFAQLVDEDERRLRLRDNSCQFSERLGHQARLQAHLRFTHLALDLSFRDERGDRVDNHDIDAVRADEHLDDFEGLFAVVRLRDQQVVDVDAQLLGIDRVKRVLRVHERRHAPQPLRFGDDLQRQRRLARRLGPEDLDDAAARDAANAQGVVDADGTGGNRFDRLDRPLLAQAHDRAFAELFLDLADGQLHGFHAFAVHPVVPLGSLYLCRHALLLGRKLL